MKRIAWLFLVVMCSVTFAYSQSPANSMKVSGTVCAAACVTQVDNLSTCDKACSDPSGEAVLVDDQGKVMKIANQDACKSHMGKHVKMTAVPTEMQREKSLQDREKYFQVLEMEELGG